MLRRSTILVGALLLAACATPPEPKPAPIGESFADRKGIPYVPNHLIGCRPENPDCKLTPEWRTACIGGGPKNCPSWRDLPAYRDQTLPPWLEGAVPVDPAEARDVRGDPNHRPIDPLKELQRSMMFGNRLRFPNS